MRVDLCLLQELLAIFGETGVRWDKYALSKKSLDLCPENLFTRPTNQFDTPIAVVMPRRNFNEQLQELIKIARQYGKSLVVRGGGSGVCGALRAGRNEIVIDMSSLDKTTLLYKPEYTNVEGLAIAEAGVFGDKLDDFLRQHDLTCGHYPASLAISTVGGWVSTKSNGHFSLYFGNIENLVTAIEGVNGEGKFVRLEGKDLQKVFRMEGTTMIVTRVWLKTFNITACDEFLSFRFDYIGETVGFLKKMPNLREQLKKLGVRLYTVRAYDFIDFKFMSKPHKGDSHKPAWLKRINYFVEKQLCRASRIINNVVGILERQGGAPWTVVTYVSSDSPEALSQAAETIKNAAQIHGGIDLGPAIAHNWYSHRLKLGYDKVIERFNAGITVDTFETTMPWDKVIEAYEEIQATIFKFGLVGAHIGIDLDRPYLYFIYGIAGSDKKKYKKALEEILQTCVRIGIATTHHHGIGKQKAGTDKKFIPHAYGQYWSLNTVPAAKNEMDPYNLLNPGNSFVTPGGAHHGLL